MLNVSYQHVWERGRQKEERAKEIEKGEEHKLGREKEEYRKREEILIQLLFWFLSDFS